jgi:hypothetical protein
MFAHHSKPQAEPHPPEIEEKKESFLTRAHHGADTLMGRHKSELLTLHMIFAVVVILTENVGLTTIVYYIAIAALGLSAMQLSFNANIKLKQSLAKTTQNLDKIKKQLSQQQQVMRLEMGELKERSTVLTELVNKVLNSCTRRATSCLLTAHTLHTVNRGSTTPW